MAKKPATFMRRNRAQYFPRKTRAKIIEWTVSTANGVVFIEILKPNAKPFALALEPDDAYELREDLGHAYDQANGI